MRILAFEWRVLLLSALLAAAVGSCGKKEKPGGEAALKAPDSAAAAGVDLLAWPRMALDEFGCMMEKTFGHKYEKFNCSLVGYRCDENPCKDVVCPGLEFPQGLAKRAHPWIRGIGLEWEHGNIRTARISFDDDRKLTAEQVLSEFGIPAKHDWFPRENIMRISIDTSRGAVSSVWLEGFEHIGAADIDCGPDGGE